ncbi:hypothetical protein PSTG_10444 [Puccinia striiformis f. sp. tritici PST-78]|uniref:Transcription factor domain-containing protein n=2 Tax=Puccinia striiformis f. sp. tritici TaxID=168172 RepID=A0A0L0VAK2_9BASI|nr:hypothetical protein PSTG_10444 [Puccinia striiformis f. sp. tritici PST-78]
MEDIASEAFPSRLPHLIQRTTPPLRCTKLTSVQHMEPSARTTPLLESPPGEDLDHLYDDAGCPRKLPRLNPEHIEISADALSHGLIPLRTAADDFPQDCSSIRSQKMMQQDAVPSESRKSQYFKHACTVEPFLFTLVNVAEPSQTSRPFRITVSDEALRNPFLTASKVMSIEKWRHQVQFQDTCFRQTPSNWMFKLADFDRRTGFFHKHHNTTTSAPASPDTQSPFDLEPHHFELSPLHVGGMQHARPNPVANLDELDIRGERLIERVNYSHSQAQDIEKSLDCLDSRLQILQQASSFTDNYQRDPMVPQSNKRICCEVPPITPKTRPKLPDVAITGYPLREPSPDQDPTVPKAVAPVGLTPTTAQIIDWPRRGDAAHSLSFILNPVVNPAKETKRDLEPPSTGSADSQDADHLGSENPTRQPMVFSGSLSTVSIPGSGAAALVRVSGVDTDDLEPTLVKEHCNTFFKRYSNRLTWCPEERSNKETLTRKSKLLLCAIISASDPKPTKSEMVSSCYHNALNMSRSAVFPERDYNIHDLKGIMVLTIYHGLHCVCPHFVSLCLTLRLHKVFVKLTDPTLRGRAKEAELVEMGRTWLLVVIYSHFLCIFSRKLYLIGSPPASICKHAETLESSEHAQPCDRLINAHVNLMMVLAHAQNKLDSRNHPGLLSERKEKFVLPEVYNVIIVLDRWAKEWKDLCPQLFTTKTEGPRRFLQNAQQYVKLYIMHAAVWPCQDGRTIITNTRRHQWALEGCQHAEGILRAVLDLKDELDFHEKNNLEPDLDDLPLNIEYHKATLGLATGYLLWVSMIIPGYVKLDCYLSLFTRLHGIEFKFSCEYIEIIEKCIHSIHEMLTFQKERLKSDYSSNDGIGISEQVHKIGTNLEARGCQLGPNELRDGCVGQYRYEDGTFVMGEDMAKDLDKLMTDTQFWFQLELE